jgi:hypothetical protein
MRDFVLIVGFFRKIKIFFKKYLKNIRKFAIFSLTIANLRIKTTIEPKLFCMSNQNPSKELITMGFKKYDVHSFVELAEKTGISDDMLHRMFKSNKHKIVSPAFKLILELIPEHELKPFLERVVKHLYHENTI